MYIETNLENICFGVLDILYMVDKEKIPLFIKVPNDRIYSIIMLTML